MITYTIWQIPCQKRYSIESLLFNFQEPFRPGSQLDIKVDDTVPDSDDGLREFQKIVNRELITHNVDASVLVPGHHEVPYLAVDTTLIKPEQIFPAPVSVDEVVRRRVCVELVLIGFFVVNVRFAGGDADFESVHI